MKFLKGLFGSWWFWSILAAVVVALILTLALPLLVHALDPLLWRLAMLAGVVLVWGIFAAIRVLSARNASDRIAKSLEKEKAAGDDEGVVAGRRLVDAMVRLRKESGGKRDYLYSRPWYLIIGPPGAGKTTALLNSGLRFPFSDAAVKGVGGTRNLDFWFADEAVMVDTAGRYTTQDSAEEQDRKGWLGFLDTLRRNRPLQPVNGVLVAVGVDTLITANVAEIDRHADVIRRRLAELREGLEITAPVYLVFTKTDLVAGFTEFFDDLDVDQRRAVLGHTFNIDDDAPDIAAVAAAFDEVAEAAGKRTARRLQDELDVRRRGLIVGFPSQFSSLRNAVTRLVEGAFPIGAREGPARLRGLYFTSGVQQGTPFDRLLGGFAQVYDTPPPAGPRTGRAYFLNRLLMEVIFGEAGLAEGTSGVKTRRRAILTGGLAAIAVVSVLVLAAWIASFMANLKFQEDLRVKTAAVAQMMQPPAFDLQTYSENDRGVEEAQQALDALRALPRGYDARRRGGPPFPMGLGLYQADLSQMAEDTYLQALQRILLPRLLLRLERYQRDHVDAPDQLYGALKTYLLLGGRKPGGGYEPATVRAWVTDDWERDALAGADHQLQRQAMTRHLDAMLKDKGLGSVWRGRDPLLTDVVTASRNRIATLSAGERAYILLRDQSDGTPWRPNLTRDRAAAFANFQTLQTLEVPYFYTRDGYVKAYIAGRPKVVAAMRADRWVLNQSDEVVDSRRIMDEIAQKYANDYVSYWRRVQTAPQPANYFSSRAATDAMVAEPSPYKAYLKEIVRQTNLAGIGAPPKGLKIPGGKAAKLVRSVVAQTSGPKGPDAGELITQAFSNLSAYVAGSKIDTLLNALQDAVTANEALQTAPPTDRPAAQAQAQAAAASLSKASLGSPEGVTGFANNIRATGASAKDTASLTALRNGYAATVLPACTAAVQGFPFDRSSANDASVSGLMQTFAVGGGLDQVTTALAPYMEQGASWRWRADAPGDLDPESADKLRVAQSIRQVLRPEGLQLKVSVIEWAANTPTVTMRIGDASATFTPDIPDVAAMRWSTSGNGVASVVFPGQPKPYEGEGDWALLRLLENAKVDSMGTSAVRARFGGPTSYVVFRIEYPAGMPNPFSGGPWTFRCPGRL